MRTCRVIPLSKATDRVREAREAVLHRTAQAAAEKDPRRVVGRDEFRRRMCEDLGIDDRA
ncbi:MAG TPA: hypothetical protein VFK80_08215 [Limnochordia bacterium]|nr:hypothetical protein [Limnochordia bacterium]